MNADPFGCSEKWSKNKIKFTCHVLSNFGFSQVNSPHPKSGGVWSSKLVKENTQANIFFNVFYLNPYYLNNQMANESLLEENRNNAKKTPMYGVTGWLGYQA